MNPGCASGFAETDNASTLVQLMGELRRVNELLARVPESGGER